MHQFRMISKFLILYHFMMVELMSYQINREYRTTESRQNEILVYPQITSVKYNSSTSNLANVTIKDIIELDIKIKIPFVDRFYLSLKATRYLSNNCILLEGFVNGLGDDSLANFDLCLNGLLGVFQWKMRDYSLKSQINDQTKSRHETNNSTLNEWTVINYLKNRSLPHIIQFKSINMTVPVFSCHTKSKLRNQSKHIQRKSVIPSNKSQAISRQKRQVIIVKTFEPEKYDYKKHHLSDILPQDHERHNHHNYNSKYDHSNHPIIHSDFVHGNVIELLIVVTTSMQKRFGKGLNRYIINNIAVAMRVLRHSSLKASLSINVVDIIPLDPSFEKEFQLDDWRSLSQEMVVNRFCDWVNQKKKEVPYKWDSALLINDGYFCCSAIGIAHLRSMCASNNCLALVDRGFGTGYIIAHELAHQMNAPHDFDDEYSCLDHEKEYSKAFKEKINTVMATSLYFENFPFVWSKCSQATIGRFLKSKDSQCLREHNSKKVLLNHRQLLNHLDKLSIGREFDLDKQCSLALREPASHCLMPDQLKQCTSLLCSPHTYRNSCLLVQAVIADGTKCDSNKHCVRGKCVSMFSQNPAIAGGWSGYSKWSICSTKCGGGIQISTRECNNPKPDLGGAYCTGPREKIRSCNLHKCKDSRDFRQRLCAIEGYRPFYPENEDSDKCSLVCLDKKGIQVNHAMKLIDGTPCTKDQRGVCFRGTCFKTGCDRILGSTKVVDSCGICGGLGLACQKIEKVFDGSNITSSAGIYWAFDVPKGVSNFYLKKTSPRSMPLSRTTFDDYTLMLMVDYYTRIRNSRSREKFAGGLLIYSGSNMREETVEIRGKLTKTVNILIRRVNPNAPSNLPVLRYHYYIPLSKEKLRLRLYEWRHLKFSENQCYGFCNSKISVATSCYNKRNNHQVSDDKCMQHPRPKNIKKDCLPLCGFRWAKPTNEQVKALSGKQCSSRCSYGLLKLEHTCLRKKIANFQHQSNTNNTRRYNEENWEIVNKILCYNARLSSEPSYNIQCKGSCPPVNWSTGPWSKCSQNIDCSIYINSQTNTNAYPSDIYQRHKSQYEFQYRNISCVDINGRQWSSKECRPVDHRHTRMSVNYYKLLQQTEPEAKRQCYYSNKEIRDKCRIKWFLGEWSSCSKTCGRGSFMSRQISCIIERSKLNSRINYITIQKSLCDSKTKPIDKSLCNYKPCLHWVLDTSKTSQCSTSCGKGTRQISHSCVAISDENSKAKIEERYRDEICVKNGLRKPHDVVTNCTQPRPACAKPKWVTSSWSKCSVTCGTGTQTRNVQCGLVSTRNKRFDIKVLVSQIKWAKDDSLCANIRRPEYSRPCHQTSRCPIWRYTPWSKCDGICEYGIQYRIKFCYQPDSDTIISNKYCNNTAHHPISRTCLLKEICGHWRVSEWSECSVRCGLGIKQRQVKCHYANGSRAYDQRICKNSPAPFSEVLCENAACIHRPFWWLLKSGKCYSYKCSPGRRSLDIKCMNRDFSILPNAVCLTNSSITRSSHRHYFNTVNSNIRRCIAPECVMKKWFAPDWDTIKCPNNSCIMTIKNRPVLCQDDYGNIYADHFCNHDNKPDNWRLCPSPRECSDIPRNCKELKRIHPESQDGEYSLAIDLNWTYFIFCADMHTKDPKEYLTLKQLNYARSSRFIQSNHSNSPDCSKLLPEQENDPLSCVNCKVQKNLFSMTYYHKVRINMTDMSIDIHDTKFSHTIGHSPVPFGTAKDCFQKKNCPQGQFKIDLTGTELSVSSQTKWAASSYSMASVNIKRDQGSQIVIGRCGYDCNGCQPQPKLFVEPQLYGRDYEERSRIML